MRPPLFMVWIGVGFFDGHARATATPKGAPAYLLASRMVVDRRDFGASRGGNSVQLGGLMWKLVVAAVIVAKAAPIGAQPIYFECSMSDAPAQADRMEVTYDEQTGSLSWDTMEGRNSKMSAVVNGEVITATNEMAPDLREVLTINRRNGAATLGFQTANEPFHPSAGTCKQVTSLAKLPHEQFTAAEYELAAHFMVLIQSRRLDAAKQMLSRGASIRTWTDDDGVVRSLGEFATYMSQCPIQELEGVNTRAAHNLNINLACSEKGGASLEFTSGKISSITYGGPPPLIMTVTAPKE